MDNKIMSNHDEPCRHQSDDLLVILCNNAPIPTSITSAFAHSAKGNKVAVTSKEICLCMLVDVIVP
jgi:hypothetical protein